MATKVTPWDIDLRVQDLSDTDRDHYEITVEPKFDLERYAGTYTFAEALAGARWVAGIAARVAVTMTQDLAESARLHGCSAPEDWGVTSCGVCCSSIEMIDPATDLGTPPGVWFYVPSSDQKQWVKRIKTALQEIVRAEQSRPSAEREKRWREGTPNAHQWADDGSTVTCRHCGLPALHPVHQVIRRAS